MDRARHHRRSQLRRNTFFSIAAVAGITALVAAIASVLQHLGR